MFIHFFTENKFSKQKSIPLKLQKNLKIYMGKYTFSERPPDITHNYFLNVTVSSTLCNTRLFIYSVSPLFTWYVKKYGLCPLSMNSKELFSLSVEVQNLVLATVPSARHSSSTVNMTRVSLRQFPT